MIKFKGRTSPQIGEGPGLETQRRLISQILLSQLALNPCQSSWGWNLGSRPAHHPEQFMINMSQHVCILKGGNGNILSCSILSLVAWYWPILADIGWYWPIMPKKYNFWYFQWYHHVTWSMWSPKPNFNWNQVRGNGRILIINNIQ